MDFIQDSGKRARIFAAIITASISGSMLATALSTALPQMIKEFGISMTLGQWVTSGFSLTMAIMMPLTAFLIKRFKTRNLFLSASMLFMLGLLLCIVSKDFTLLMTGRVIQAIGSGMTSSLAQVITLTIYPPEKKGTAMGWYGLSLAAAPIIAPALAGIIIDAVGWRMIFVISLAISVMAFIYSCFVLENVLDTSESKFDVFSFLLSAIAFGGITLGVGNITKQGLFAIACLALGLMGATAFSIRQLRLQSPFLDIRIFKERNYTFSVLASMVLYLVMMAASVMIPIYVQSIRGFSATVSGLVVLPGALATAAISPLAGKLYDRFGIKVLLLVSSVCLISSNLLTGLATENTPIVLIAVYNVVRNIAVGSIMMPLVTWGASSLPKDRTSDATALINSLRTISGAIGIAVFVSMMNSLGFGIASICMAAVSAVLLIMAFCVKIVKQ